MKQVKVVIKGKVTGVFFRAFINEKANELGLLGYVKNTEENNVEAVFQGTEEKINQVISYCYQGSSQSKVEDVKSTEEPLEKFTIFEIK